MNTKILALAGILLAVAAFTFVFPLSTAGMETTACNPKVCIINKASKSQEAPIAEQTVRCSLTLHDCNWCCNFCATYATLTVGLGQQCGCEQGEEYNYCP